MPEMSPDAPEVLIQTSAGRHPVGTAS